MKRCAALVTVSRSILGEPKRPPELDIISSLYLVISSSKASERIANAIYLLFGASVFQALGTLSLLFAEFLKILFQILLLSN